MSSQPATQGTKCNVAFASPNPNTRTNLTSAAMVGRVAPRAPQIRKETASILKTQTGPKCLRFGSLLVFGLSRRSQAQAAVWCLVFRRHLALFLLLMTTGASLAQ